MATELAAGAIGARFREEQEYIRRYIELLRTRLVPSSSDVWDVRGVLQSWKLVPPKANLGRERNPPELTAEQIGHDVASLAEVVPAINQAVEEQETLLQKLFPAGESPTLTAHQSEWVDYLEGHYADALLTMEHEEILTQCVRQHDSQCPDAEEQLDEDAVREAIRYAAGLRSIRKMQALEHARKGLREMQILLRVVSPDAEINILRQGFILLMTAFDAAIFDLMRVKLRKDFFSLVGVFGRQEKVSLQEIGEAGTFEVFRDEIIEEQMKKRYIKDLLFVLEALNVRCTDEVAGDRFVQLIELVLRRNVHVHNRGIVDARYLECDQNGSPKYNLYKLDLGDVGRIDEPYWELANRLCSQCVNRVAAWADA